MRVGGGRVGMCVPVSIIIFFFMFILSMVSNEMDLRWRAEQRTKVLGGTRTDDAENFRKNENRTPNKK